MKTIFYTGLFALGGALISATALAQTTQTRDVSAELQASLSASAPTVVYFDFDKDEVKDDAKAVLDQQASWLLANPNAKVDLAGHTDAVGSNEYNDDLAMRRANAVQAYLFARGVNANQMRSVISQGENSLAVATQKRERMNRRVTTGVTGLVVVNIVERAPERPMPAPRVYTDSGDVCVGKSATQLAGFSSGNALESELMTRMEMAGSAYSNSNVQGNDNHVYNLASFTKVECGIAIGYNKKGIVDKRSIGNCECYADLLPKNL